MRTDYKEERKWKIATAFLISRAVMEYHEAPDKSLVCIKSRHPVPLSESREQDQTADEQPTTTTESAPSTETATSQPAETDVTEAMEVDGNQSTDKMDEEKPQESKDTAAEETSENAQQDSMEPAVTEETEQVDTQPATEVKAEETAEPRNAIMDGQVIQTDAAAESSTAPTLSQEVVQNYRAIVRDLDGNIPIVSLPVEEFGSFDINAVFPDLLQYEPPNPDYDDPYFDEAEYGRIVAITKLATTKYIIKKRQRLTRKRDIDGNQLPTQVDEEEEEEVRVLPRHDRYDTTPLISRKYIWSS